MAKTDDTGEAFIREVDEEYRRQKLGNAFQRYGRWLLLGIGALLLAVAAFLYWRGLERARADARAAAFATALGEMRGNRAKQADATLDALARAPEAGYRALALIERAGAAATGGDSARAARLYNQAAAKTDLAKPFRDLALIKATQIEFDTLAPAAVIARLRPMALPGNPWFGTAGELTALAQLKAGQPGLAKPLFDALAKDESVPVSIRGRAQQLSAGIGAPAPGPAPTPVPLARQPAPASPVGLAK